MNKMSDQVNTLDNTSNSEIHSVSDKGNFRGMVRVTVEENGVSTLVWEDPNLIVDSGRKVLTHLLASADNNYKVNSIKLGTKGHNLTTGDILTPVASIISQTDLIDTATTFQKEIGTDFTYQGFTPPDSSVMFQVVLEKQEGNGSGIQAYTEAGLFTVNGTMFARETFPAIVKNANRRITFQWVILF